VESADQLPNTTVTDLVVVTTYPNGHQEVVPRCRVPLQKTAEVTATMVRDEAEKLLPHPAIGVAPPGHITLVNIETVLWVDTSPDRTLGTVTLLGQRVDLRAHIERVRWNFGDGVTDSTDGPGAEYTAAHPCTTQQCPGYFGHTYRRSDTVTITADLVWTGEFRVEGGAWQPIPGTVTAAATSTTVDVKEARSVLVPNP
ncbi:MAG: hypothetical protein QOH89_2912, partial [Pseudonocardiales bacterium]|nr:hypothetical protein [Pseudonocardiales bacterium]